MSSNLKYVSYGLDFKDAYGFYGKNLKIGNQHFYPSPREVLRDVNQPDVRRSFHDPIRALDKKGMFLSSIYNTDIQIRPILPLCRVEFVAVPNGCVLVRVLYSSIASIQWQVYLVDKMADNDLLEELTVEHGKRTLVANAFERIGLLFQVLVSFSSPEESAVKSGIQWLALKGEKDKLSKAKVCTV